MTNAANLSIVIDAINNTNRSLQQIRRDLSGLDVSSKKAGSSLASVGKIAGGFIVAKAITELPGLLRSAAVAAAEDAASQARLQQAVNNTGVSYVRHAAQLEQVIKQGQRLAFSDSQTRDSLSLLAAQTGSVTEATRRYALAQDLARGANIDVITASRLLGKVTEENVNVLARYGISIRKGADATELLAAVQQKFGGQAQVFADSAAGQMARFSDRVEEAAEAVGTALIPAMTLGLDAGFAFFDALDKGASIVTKLTGGTNTLQHNFKTSADAMKAAEKASSSLEKMALLKLAATLKDVEKNADASKNAIADVGTEFDATTSKAANFNRSLTEASQALAGFGKARTPEQLKLEAQLADINKQLALQKVALDQAERSGQKQAVQSVGSAQRQADAYLNLREAYLRVGDAQEEFAKNQTLGNQLNVEQAQNNYAKALQERANVQAESTVVVNKDAEAIKKQIEELEKARGIFSNQLDVLVATREANIKLQESHFGLASSASGLSQSEEVLNASITAEGKAYAETARQAGVLLEARQALGVNPQTPTPVFPSFPRTPTRDAGGPVTAGQPYMIGRGPYSELFVPRESGNVIPHSQVNNNQRHVSIYGGTFVMPSGGGSDPSWAFQRI